MDDQSYTYSTDSKFTVEPMNRVIKRKINKNSFLKHVDRQNQPSIDIKILFYIFQLTTNNFALHLNDTSQK